MTSMQWAIVLLALAACSETPTKQQEAADAGPIADGTPTPDACSPLPEEVCGNRLDDTCDGQVDEGCPLPGSHLWAVAMGGPLDEDTTTAVAATPESGVIALLQHDGEATFGKGQANETFLPAPHPHQQLLSAGRYDASGELLWARRLALNTTIQRELTSQNLLYTSDDGLIIAGSFTGSITIGPDTINPIQLDVLGGRNGFVARFAADGEVLWAKQTSGTMASGAVSLAQLSDGRIAIAGSGSGEIVFDPGEPTEQILPAENGFVAYVAWYSEDGAFERAAHITGYPSFQMQLAAGDKGSTLLAMDGLVEINSNESVASTDTSGIFVCHFAANGTVTDLSVVAEGQLIELGGMARGTTGNLFMTGSYRNTVLFAPGRTSEIELSTGGMFVVHFDSNLELSWLRSVGADVGGRGFAIAADPALPGGAVVGGYFAGETIFGEGEAGATTLNSDGTRALFVARYEANGDINWVRSARNGGSYNRTDALTLRTDGSVVAAGQIGTTTIFGEGQDNATSLDVDHISEGFLAVFGL